MVVNVVMVLLLLLGLGLIVLKVAKDKGWVLPASLASFVAGAGYWFKDIMEYVDKFWNLF